MLAENVNHASAGLKKEFGLQSEESLFEFTLPPHNDGAAHRVSVGIESCFQAQSEFQ
jgi:hypothetical protein